MTLTLPYTDGGSSVPWNEYTPFEMHNQHIVKDFADLASMRFIVSVEFIDEIIYDTSCHAADAV